MAGSDPMTTLAQHLDEYLKLRRALGHKLGHAHRYLPRFVTYLDEQGAEFVTVEAALAWSLERAMPVGSVVPADRMMVVRGFARYLSGIDARTEVPPTGTIRHPHRWRRPFIYSDADVLAMIEQARFVIPQPLRSATYQTLIGLLATTGMRIGEALRLDRADLDRTEGVLRIRESKFGKSRLVPLHASTVDALERYDHTRQQLLPEPSTEALFVSLRGTRVIYETVWPTHRMLCELAGVGVGSTVTPRIHDHRHSMAVKTLLGWYQDGLDVPSRIGWLSTYLGHREPRYTYHYLSAAPDLLAHAARLLNDAQAARP
jgi:integrase